MALMSRYPDKYFDLAVVDPPYGIGQFNMQSQVNKKIKKWDYDWNNEIPNIDYFNELKRVSKEQIIWGANYYNCFNNRGGAIVWYKDVKHPNMSKCEIASYSRLKKVDFYRYDWSNTDKFNELRQTDIHPCQKPVALYDWLFKNYAKQGDKILDTHLGSGSSRIAAHKAGLDFIGCELDTNYFAAAEKRYKDFSAQLNLFV
jgi:site-specific DNA-methyltransferase (adenine-specific)